MWTREQNEIQWRDRNHTRVLWCVTHHKFQPEIPVIWTPNSASMNRVGSQRVGETRKMYAKMGWVEWISVNILKTARVYWRAPVLLVQNQQTNPKFLLKYFSYLPKISAGCSQGLHLPMLQDWAYPGIWSKLEIFSSFHSAWGKARRSAKRDLGCLVVSQ